MSYSLVKIIGSTNANVCCINKLGYSSLLQLKIKSSLGGSCVLPMDPEHKLKKKLKKKLKNSSKKLKTQAKNSKSWHFLNCCLPEMRSKRKPDLNRLFFCSFLEQCDIAFSGTFECGTGCGCCRNGDDDSRHDHR